MPAQGARMTYGDYLGLEDLLSLQRPLSRCSNDARASEIFFIVAHQSSELWLKSMLWELQALDDALIEMQPLGGCPLQHARRALAGAHSLVANVETLRSLEPAAFLAFREQLGSASGAQSSQFARLRDLMGIGLPEGGPIERHLLDYKLALNGGAEAVMGDYRWLSGVLLDLSSVVWRWGLLHLDVTQRLIGNRRGTGDTSGARYLASRIMERPFPTLTHGYEPPKHSLVVPSADSFEGMLDGTNHA